MGGHSLLWLLLFQSAYYPSIAAVGYLLESDSIGQCGVANNRDGQKKDWVLVKSNALEVPGRDGFWFQAKYSNY